MGYSALQNNNWLWHSTRLRCIGKATKGANAPWEATMATSSSGFWAPQHLCPSRAPITLDATIIPDLEISSSSSDFKPSTWGRTLLRWVTVKDWEMAAEQKLSRTCCHSRFYLKHADFNCYFLNFRTTTVITLALELGRTLRARIRCPHMRVVDRCKNF